MTDRTITIDTRDHGPVTIPEPAWCTGIAHEPTPTGQGGPDMRPRRSEIVHTGPSIDISVGTERGPRRLLELLLWQDPFPVPSSSHGVEVYVVAALLDGDHFGYDADALDVLATDLLEAAGRVRLVARRLRAEDLGGDR